MSSPSRPLTRTSEYGGLPREHCLEWAGRGHTAHGALTSAGSSSGMRTSLLRVESACAYDALAPDFDRARSLPEGAAAAVRDGILATLDHLPSPRLLDLGA